MKKKNIAISLLMAAALIPTLPFSALPKVSADDYDDKWAYLNKSYGPHGELCYKDIIPLKDNYTGEITIPTEYNGIPITEITHRQICLNFANVCRDTENHHLVVHVPEGIRFNNAMASPFMENCAETIRWPEDMQVDFVLSDGRTITYTGRWNEIYPTGDNESLWEYELTEDGNARITAYKGKARNMTIPDTIGGHTVTAVGERIFGDIEEYPQVNITIPETVVEFGRESFYGIHYAFLTYQGNRYELYHDDDPETPDYLVLNKPKYILSDINFRDEEVTDRLEGVDYDKIPSKLRELVVRIPDHVAGYPVVGVSGSSADFSRVKALILPDTVKFIRQGAFINSDIGYLRIPEGLKILPTKFANQRFIIDGMENVKYIHENIYGDANYDTNKNKYFPFDNDEKMYPKDKVIDTTFNIDDPFKGFPVTADGRTYFIRMSRKDFEYYAELIYEAGDLGEIPDTFMGFPVIDKRSDELNAIAGELTIPEDVHELSLTDLKFDPDEFTALTEKGEGTMFVSVYPTYIDALKGNLHFEQLHHLKKINFLSKDITINENTFATASVTELLFPGDVHICTDAFAAAPIEKLGFTGKEPTITIDRNGLFFMPIKDITFPDKVKELSIGEKAVCGMGAEELTLPDGKVSIGESAFSDCGNLKKLTISDSAHIGDNAFANCKALEDVTINGSNDIGNYVFSGCSALKNINIDLDEKFNGNNLYRCSSLETINNTDPFNADGSPKPEFLGFIKRNMNNVDDNPLINKYVTYCVKGTAKDIIRDSMTDMEKVKAIHDHICGMVSYDTGNEDDLKNHNDASVFLNETTVCDGYSRAMNLLLHEVGIDSCLVHTPTHSWVVVEIGGHYFHVDPTWDDGEKIDYDWFMKADSEIKDEPSHKNWHIAFPSALHSFQWENVPECKALMGDVNSDGVVDGNDASAVLRSYAKASAGNVPETDSILSDYNFDGRSDARDAAAILKKYAESAVG